MSLASYRAAPSRTRVIDQPLQTVKPVSELGRNFSELRFLNAYFFLQTATTNHDPTALIGFGCLFEPKKKGSQRSQNRYDENVPTYFVI